MSPSGYKSKAERLESEVADLKSMDRRERAKAAKELARARSRLGEIDVCASLEERLAKEAEAERFEQRAAKYDRKAAAIGQELTEIGDRLRRMRGSVRPGQGGDAVYRFDVFLSFADEQRDYVEQVADALTARGYRVFYDGYEDTNIWGRHMTEEFDSALREESRCCVPFISKEYREKKWTMWEWRSALARTLEDDDFLLPARFDDTKMPGLLPTVKFADLRKLTQEEFVVGLAAKLGPVN